MPNGEDKNWVRACAAMEGFFMRYGHWPTRLRFPRPAFEEFRQLFHPDVLQQFLARFEIVIDDRFFAAESDGGRRYDYMVEGLPTGPLRCSAREHFGASPEMTRPTAQHGEGRDVATDMRYDLTVAGRALRWLEPAEVVREVVRFLLLEFRWNAATVNECARVPLLREVPGARPLMHGDAATAESLSAWYLRDVEGRTFSLERDRDWSDYRTLLYRFDAEVPIGMVQWRESLFLRKSDVVQRLQLASPLGPAARRYVKASSTTGPLPNSYRVSELPLFGGECPRSEKDLLALRHAGVDCVIDLRDGEPGEQHRGSEERRAEYHRHPVAPGGLPTRDGLETILDTIEDSLGRGKIVYLHDRGGLGRTTVVLACLLTRWGLTAHEAVDEIVRLAQTMPKAAGRPIPETAEQRAFILRWGGR